LTGSTWTSGNRSGPESGLLKCTKFDRSGIEDFSLWPKHTTKIYFTNYCVDNFYSSLLIFKWKVGTILPANGEEPKKNIRAKSREIKVNRSGSFSNKENMEYYINY
jgi:hypothetical protein